VLEARSALDYRAGMTNARRLDLATPALAVTVATLTAACGGSSKSAPPPQPPTTPVETAATEDPRDEPREPTQHKALRVVTPEERTWTPITDKGDAGASVAMLWGELEEGPSGFLFRLPAGDPGGLHSHRHDYHAVAISGANAAAQDGGKSATIPQGTYWYQPGGVAHTNACGKGEPCIVLMHFNDGRFDDAPATPVKGARRDPRHVEKRLKDIRWIPFDDKNPKGGGYAPLWGDPQAGPSGILFRLPPGNPPLWHIHRHDYHGVLLAGTLSHYESGGEPRELAVGTYWWQPGGYKHVDLCKAGGSDCIIYGYFTGAFDVKPAE
jgi:quercetin dioxygenase-like cupin family protein